MSDFHTALGGTIAALGVGMTVLGRNWPTGQRREPISEELMTELLGPPTPYTTAFEHAPGPIKTGFAYCSPCGRDTAGSLNKDGWLCGECLTPAGHHATTHTTTGDR